MNFENLKRKCEILARNNKKIEKFEEEPIIVFMVYETFTNKCSERNTLLEVFNKHGLNIEELKYPIKENY